MVRFLQLKSNLNAPLVSIRGCCSGKTQQEKFIPMDEQIAKNKYALIVEDDVSVQSVLTLALSEAGFEVMTATTGSEALKILHETMPGIVLLDIGLPDFEGYEICKMLSAEDLITKIPVIVISGCTSLQNRLRSFIWGAKTFVSKPFQLDDLIEKVIYLTERNETSARQPAD